ncbi:MAG TPA: MFS transporter [Candidatus Acidoferrum sp.]|nr:MFS transporter [Candidatus Acidoferrum sp.]
MNWRNRSFLKLWAGQSVSELGTSVSTIALPTLAVFQLHAGPFELGLLAAFQRLPFPILALPIGVWIDQLPRRRVMILADVGRTIALASIPITAIIGSLSLVQLYVVAMVTGLLTIFFDLAYLSYVPALVGRENLGDANAKLTLSDSISTVAGPGLGGLLIQAVGAGQAIAVDAASYVVSFASVIWIRGDDASPIRTGPAASAFADLKEGIAHVFRHPLLRSLILCIGGAVVLGHLEDANLYPFLYNILHLSPGTAGLVISVGGLGSIAGALLSRRVAARLGPGWTLAISGAILGVMVMLMTTARFGLAIPILVITFLIIGVMNPIHDVTQVSLRQMLTPDRLQGRMNSVFRTVFWGAWPLGSVIGGYLGSVLGPVPAIIIGGGGFAVFGMVVLFTPLRTARI